MIITSNKSNCTLERLAVENEFLKENLKQNINELIKRKKELKYEIEQNELAIILKSNRKTFCYEILKLPEFEYNHDIELKVEKFLKEEFENNGNKIKELIKIYNFYYIKTKYNEIKETLKIETPEFVIEQINPKFIMKKQKNLITNIY